jgi:4-amino-4-deoxy-L-arabinose transferase-like glycosyltransferase
MLWLAAGALVLFALFLGARDLWNPNEPLYGRAVVEMARQGDWLVPTVNEMTFDEKPILYFWMALVFSKLLGVVNEFTLRLPLVLAGVVGVVLVYLLVYPYSSRSRARLAAALFGTTFVVWWSARSLNMDLLVTVMTLAAVLAVSRVLDHGGSPWRGWALAGAAAGAGFLAKGPVGLICPGLTVLLYIAWTGRWKALRPGPLLLAAAACVAVAAPWYLWLWAAGETDFLVEVLYRQNFTRFHNPWDHQAPWWYYLPYLAIDMAPWALFLPLAFRLPGRDADERRLERLCWVWIAGIVFFFSLSASKRSAYILPVAPAVAILAAALADRFLGGRLERWRNLSVRWVLGAQGLLLLCAGIYLRTVALDRYPIMARPGGAVALLLVAGGAAILSGLALRGRAPLAAPAALFSSVACLYLLAGAWLLPEIDVYKSARPFCQQVNAEVGPDEPLSAYRQWKWRASYVYYADRRIDLIDTPQELLDYWARPEQVYLLVEQRRFDEVQDLLGHPDPVIQRPLGTKRVYLFTNRPPG